MGPKSVRDSIDVETEEIESRAKPGPCGPECDCRYTKKWRLTIQWSPGVSAGLDDAEVGGRTGETPVAPSRFPTALGFVFAQSCIRRAITAIPELSTTKAICATTASACSGRRRRQDIARLPGFSCSRIQLWRTRVHSSIVAKIHQLWPASQASLMDAMVLGEESFLRNATRTEYQRSGTYHVLVVSGMNLSILAFAIFLTLRQFRVDPAVAAITTVVVSFAYAFVVGVGPPVWRAALMLATYLGARLLYRGRNMMNAIGAAALGVLIADPHALFGASFQLTFLAVFIIAGIGSPILERTTLPYARGLRLLRAASYDLHVTPAVAQFRLDLRLIGGRLEDDRPFNRPDSA